MRRRSIGGCLLPAVIALAACSAPPPPDAALDRARAAYDGAASDPQVTRLAPLELQQSNRALQSATQAWTESSDAGSAEYYAYLADKYAVIARERAKLRAAQQRIAGAGAERDKYVIGALAARATGQGLVLTLGDILFDTGRAELKPGAAPTIKRLADFLKRHPDRTVLIEGYTDSTGSTEINRWLSEERAQAVRTALIGQGMDPSRIQARGRGAADPVASNDTAAGRQQNRRVEISFPRSVDRTVSR